MASPATERESLVRGLGLSAAIAVNVANIIGTGVFLKARVMTCNVGTPGVALTVWLVAGLLSLAGALTYAELLAMFPRAAGEYVVMRDAYGRPWGFIYGWTQFAIARSASAAALAVGFAIFLNDLLGGSLKHVYFSLHLPGGYDVPFGRLQLIALGAIAVTVLINCAAVSFSGNVATVLTSIKVLLLIGVGLGAFFYSNGCRSCKTLTRRNRGHPDFRGDDDFFVWRAACFDTRHSARALRDGARRFVLRGACEGLAAYAGPDSLTCRPGNLVRRARTVGFVRHVNGF